MKRLLIFFLLATFSFSSFSQSKSSSDVYVKSYTRSNGTVVKGYYRTAPNSTNRDNFTTRGNVNPYTGKKGYIKPDNKPYSSNKRLNNYGGSSTARNSTFGKQAPLNGSLFYSDGGDTAFHYSGIDELQPMMRRRGYPTAASYIANKSKREPAFTKLLTLNDLEITFSGSGEGKMVFYKKSGAYYFDQTLNDWKKPDSPIKFEKIWTYEYKNGVESKYHKSTPFGGLLKIEASNMILENDNYIFIDDGIATFTDNELDIILEKNIILTLKNVRKNNTGNIYYYVFSPPQLKVLSMFNIKEILFRVNREYIDKKTGKLNEDGKIFNYVSKITTENTKELFIN